MNPARLKVLGKFLESKGLDAALLSSRKDIYYYTGYMPSDGLALVGSGKPVLFVSPLETDAEKVKGVEIVFAKSKENILKKIRQHRKIGYDEFSLMASKFIEFRRVSHLVKFSDGIKKPREVKDTQELEFIKKAASINRKIISSLVLHRVSEKDVAARIDIEMREFGAANAFETIVAAGRNSRMIHHRPGKAIVSKTQPLIIDFGAKFEWYCSDVTKSFSGKDKKMGKVLEEVKNMQGQITDFAVAGKTMKDMQEFYKKLMAKKGYKVYHSFGHGVGLDVHENITGQLRNNMVFTIEPGVYLRNAGCRVEDTFILRNGKARKL